MRLSEVTIIDLKQFIFRLFQRLLFLRINPMLITTGFCSFQEQKQHESLKLLKKPKF